MYLFTSSYVFDSNFALKYAPDLYSTVTYSHFLSTCSSARVSLALLDFIFFLMGFGNETLRYFIRYYDLNLTPRIMPC